MMGVPSGITTIVSILIQDQSQWKEEGSVGCDGCDIWHHYNCVNFDPGPEPVEGEEGHDDKEDPWFCRFCLTELNIGGGT